MEEIGCIDDFALSKILLASSKKLRLLYKLVRGSMQASCFVLPCNLAFSTATPALKAKDKAMSQ